MVSAMMDVSEVPSNSKTNFSIERILSENSTRNRDEADVPSWLCCTRYRPPRLPRAATSACRSRRSGRHARVPFTAAQAAALEAAYARAPYLAPPALRALAAALQLRDDRIKIWFQNRRARERREKCASIAPPNAITLPPTAAAHMTPADDIWREHRGRESSLNADTFLHRQEIEVSKSHGPEQDSAYSVPLSLLYNRSQLINEYSDPTSGRCESPLDIETVDE